jgi:hypothetical protein
MKMMPLFILKNQHDAGLTLVELLIAIMLSTGLLTGVYLLGNNVTAVFGVVNSSSNINSQALSYDKLFSAVAHDASSISSGTVHSIFPSGYTPVSTSSTIQLSMGYLPKLLNPPPGFTQPVSGTTDKVQITSIYKTVTSGSLQSSDEYALYIEDTTQSLNWTVFLGSTKVELGMVTSITPNELSATYIYPISSVASTQSQSVTMYYNVY